MTPTSFSSRMGALAVGALLLAPTVQAGTLRLLTRSGYAPANVIAAFEKATGNKVEVTLSNNEEMIAKLRATDGGGFDLAQPSQDRIAEAQAEYDIYKPIDLTQVRTDHFIPSMLKTTEANTSHNGKVYGVPFVWGTSGLVEDTTRAAVVRDYTDLCNPAFKGRVSYQLKRPALIGFAFAMGMNPFAAYSDQAAYRKILARVEAKLITCKPNVKTYWSGGDQILDLLRSGDVVAAMAKDTVGWKLNASNPNITFIAPKSGALGWIDTFALPKRGRADKIAYQWINFVTQPEIAAMVVAAAGDFTAVQGSNAYIDKTFKARFRASFSQSAIDNIKWYPPVPAGLVTLEDTVLKRIKAAR